VGNRSQELSKQSVILSVHMPKSIDAKLSRLRTRPAHGLLITGRPLAGFQQLQHLNLALFWPGESLLARRLSPRASKVYQLG